jgi:aryl-alcohol dehydrogenase-like predicted oxidoreductase
VLLSQEKACRSAESDVLNYRLLRLCPAEMYSAGPLTRPLRFRFLDAFVDAGLDFIDTADVYSAWLPGNQRASLKRSSARQPEYNLYDRAGYESDNEPAALANQLGVVVYYSLASGFLSGKYLSQADRANKAHGSQVERYLNERGLRIPGSLDWLPSGMAARRLRLHWHGSSLARASRRRLPARPRSISSRAWPPPST